MKCKIKREIYGGKPVGDIVEVYQFDGVYDHLPEEIKSNNELTLEYFDSEPYLSFEVEAGIDYIETNEYFYIDLYEPYTGKHDYTHFSKDEFDEYVEKIED